MKRTKMVSYETQTVSCDGGPELGHPTIYLSMDREKEVICPYCSQHFVVQKTKKYPRLAS